MNKDKAVCKAATFDQPGALMVATINLLKERDLLEVYNETHISYYWLRKFVSYEFQNPSVNRVQYLYEHLTGTRVI